MVVLYSYMGCSGGPTYFSTFHCSKLHLSTMPEMILQNIPADNEAGGSGAAAQQQQHEWDPWCHPLRAEFTIQYPEFSENFHKFTIFFTTFFTIFFRHDFQNGIFHWKWPKSMISGMNSWKVMISGVPGSVLAKVLHQSSYMNSWKIENSYLNSWKNIWFWVDQDVSWQSSNTNEFIYENKFNEFIREFTYEIIF